ncbi:MAG TPA: hypothetical protein ENJ25_00485 [Firmicutes bacterium]|uniref:Uncharacterized protein n=1 Tax=candidate division TA06 bacterium TaxID=2250710 RepID=A0A660S7S9_UNCT6|nr:hypothetical protein [candidate division WOR-3 bacterium]RKX66247.1 MAG: hypothetical protein DRP44_04525 [candidate division TA06 bacterium]HFD04603.1 hypothetical protein [Bacillota bacterium]
MKRLFLLIVAFPGLLFSFQSGNLKTLVEVGCRTEISSLISDSLHFDLFLIRSKYSGDLSDNITIFLQGEYSTFGDITTFPYFKTRGGKLYLRDALFIFKLQNFGVNVGRFVPNLNYMLSQSILELPTVHYSIVNERFLNNRIDGIEGDYSMTVPYNKIRLNMTFGEYNGYKYKSVSINDAVGENAVFSLYAGSRDTLWSKFNDYIMGGYSNFRFGPFSIIGEIGKHQTPTGGNLFYSIYGMLKFRKLWFGFLFDSYGNNSEIATSADFWIVENRFDINAKYEINLNKNNKFYLLLKGII